jgi:hypothetical protein
MYMGKEISQKDFESFLEYTARNHIESMMTIDKSVINHNGGANKYVNKIKKGMPLTNGVNFPEISKASDAC